jgi:hypothetical protein
VNGHRSPTRPLVLEHLEGRSLEGLIAARGALRPRDALWTVRQMAGLEFEALDPHVRAAIEQFVRVVSTDQEARS